MDWKESIFEDGKCWWMTAEHAPCVAQVFETNGRYKIAIFDGAGEGFSQSTGHRNLAQAKHVAARRFEEAVTRATSRPPFIPLDAVLEPDFLYIP